MKTINIKNNWFAESDLRLDASYHLSDGPLTKLKLKNAPYKISELSSVTVKIFKGNIFKRAYVSNAKYGYPFLTASDMMKSDIEGGKFISRKYTDVANLLIKEGWILVSRSGTLGNVTFTNKDFEGILGTDDLIRIIPNNSDVKGGCLYAYLASKYGYGLLTQSGYGGVIQHIEPHHIEDLPIPIFSEDKQYEIHNLIIEASNLRLEANKLLKEAVYEIEKSLSSKPVRNSQFDMVSIKRLFSNYQLRLDSPTYVNPGISKIDHLKKLGYKFRNINEFAIKISRPGIFKRIKVKKENGLPYLKGSELSKQNPFGLCEYLSKTRTPFLEELILRENQILFTCAGTVGDTKLISAEFEEKKAIGSQDIIRIESNDPELSVLYLYAYLKVPFIRDFIQAHKYGSVIERVEPFHVELIPVYIPESKIKKSIELKVEQYKTNNYTAFKKEERAIGIVEKEIESWQES